MNANLYQNFYYEKNDARRRELEQCFKYNLNAGFDSITLIVEEQDEKYVKNVVRNNIRKHNVVVATSDCRPTFQDYFDLFDDNSDSLNCFANADIFIDGENLNKLKTLPWEKNLAICLSRWDYTSEGYFHLERKDSADFWTVRSTCKIKNFPCKCGPGVDNRLAWEFKNAGYKVVNPSKDIKTIHLHQNTGNNYRKDGFGEVDAFSICPEPYEFHLPIFSHEI